VDERAIIETLKHLTTAAEDARAEWKKQGDEISKFGYGHDYAFLYETQHPDLFFKACVNRASEFIDIMGPYLYPENPVVQVSSSEWASAAAKRRHALEQRYGDWSAKEGKLAEHARRAIDQACIYGRGCLWPVFNPKKELVQMVWEDVLNVSMDPHARTMEEVRYWVRKRCKPRFELSAKFPEKVEVVAKLPGKDAKASPHTVSDTVEFYEVYLKTPLSAYNPKLNDLPPEVLKFTYSGDSLLAQDSWEVPYDQDDMAPCVFVDLTTPGPKSLWPRSPLFPGLGHMKALNWLYSLFISKYRTTVRTPFISAKYNGQGIDDDKLMELVHGEDLSIIKVSINGDPLPLSHFVQQFQFNSGVDEFERFAAILGREFERATGLYELLYSGQAGTQARSATESEMRERKAMGRVDEMARRVQQTMTDVFRHILFAARFLQTPEDLTPILGPEAEWWGNLAPSEEVAQEQAMRQQIREQGLAAGMPPEEIEAGMGPESLVSLTDWVREADRGIESDSMRRIDHDAQVDNLNVALNQLAPTVAATPGGLIFVSALAMEFARLHRFSPAMQAAAQQMLEMNTQAAMAPPMPPEGEMPLEGEEGDPNAVV